MPLETLTVAVGPNDESRVDELTTTLIDIAGSSGASVILLHVFSENAYEEGIDEAGFEPDDPPSPDELASRLESVVDISAALEEVGIDYRVEGKIGAEADTILQSVEELDTDVLFISGRKRSPTGKAMFGSTAHKVMMNASCPVMFVREGFAESE